MLQGSPPVSFQIVVHSSWGARYVCKCLPVSIVCWPIRAIQDLSTSVKVERNVSELSSVNHSRVYPRYARLKYSPSWDFSFLPSALGWVLSLEDIFHSRTGFWSHLGPRTTTERRQDSDLLWTPPGRKQTDVEIHLTYLIYLTYSMINVQRLFRHYYCIKESPFALRWTHPRSWPIDHLL